MNYKLISFVMTEFGLLLIEILYLESYIVC